MHSQSDRFLPVHIRAVPVCDISNRDYVASVFVGGQDSEYSIVAFLLDLPASNSCTTRWSHPSIFIIRIYRTDPAIIMNYLGGGLRGALQLISQSL